MDELLARLRAARRRAGEDPEPVAAGDLVVDFGLRRVTRAGKDVHLTPKEWALLEALVRAGGRVVTQSELLHEVWGPAYSREGNYLRTFFGTLRKKLEADPSRPRHLLTEPGVGYRFHA
jgi:two-component system, OmpR family, KDP operon response regulator KdpE